MLEMRSVGTSLENERIEQGLSSVLLIGYVDCASARASQQRGCIGAYLGRYLV